MRDIKFRAWNKKMGMVNQGDMTLGRYFDHYIHPIELWELMQFTGLHDKNGKEIYEGDILDQVAYPKDDPCPFSIVFEDGSFRVKYPGWDETLMKPIFDSGYLSVMDYAVLGNVHENPELFKESK